MAFSGNLVPDAISAEDGSKIPQDILAKIELYINTMCESNCALRDTWRTKEDDYEQRISNYELESANMLREVAAEREKHHACRLALEEMEKQFEALKTELSLEQRYWKSVEGENAELRNLKDFATLENGKLQKMLALDEADAGHLKERCRTLVVDLQRASDAKYEALVKYQEEKSAAEALQSRCDKLEMRLTTVRRHEQDLVGSLNKYKADLVNARREYVDKLLALEAQLMAKSEECAKQARVIDNMRNSLKTAEDMVRKMGGKLNEQQSNEIRMKECFEKELASASELTNIYKDLSKGGELAVKEALSRAEEMNLELKEAVSLYQSSQEKQARCEQEYKKLLAEKDECIAAKEQEIKATYDLISATVKEEVTEAVDKLPAESDLRRQLQDCGSLVNFIQHCASLSKKLHTLKQENKLHVMYMQKLFEEVEAKSPLVKKQKEDRDRAMSMVVQQSQQMDALSKELAQSQERESSLQSQLASHEQENFSLRSQLADMGSQVCHLLREVERARAGDVGPSEEVSENLIIFGSVEELQEQNRKLLELYAELNVQKETVVETEDALELKETLHKYEAQLKTMYEEVENYKTMMRSLCEERNTYRKLYHQMIYGTCSTYEKDVEMSCRPSDFTVEELTKKLVDMDGELRDLRELSVARDKEQLANEKLAKDEHERLVAELGKVNDEAAKLYGELQKCQHKLKTQEEAVNAGRRQLSLLEGQNSVYSNEATKNKHAVDLFRQASQSLEQKVLEQEVQMERLWREMEEARAGARGTGPQEDSAGALHARVERLAQMLDNLGAAKEALEHWEEEQGAGAKEQLSSAYQECLALSHDMQESRKDFEEERKKFLSDIDASLKKVIEERKMRSKFEEELGKAREEIEKKSCEIIELNKMLLESRLTWRTSTHSPQSTSTPELNSWRRQAGDLESQLAQKQGELELLQLHLGEAQGQAATFSHMCEKFERQWNEECDQHKADKELFDRKLSEASQVEAKLRSEVKELADRISKVSADSSGASTQLQCQLDEKQVEVLAAQQERDALREELTSAQQMIASLRESLADMEKHYRREEVVHVTDNQMMTRLKEELGVVSGQLAALTADKQAAVAALSSQQEQWSKERCQVQEELSQLEERVSELEAQNALLHDQLEALSSRATLQQQQAQQLNNSGFLSANSSMNNSSLLLEEEQTPEQLMKIIQFLRKEIHTVTGKLVVARSENALNVVQLSKMKEQLDEAKQSLATAQKKVDAHVATAVEHEERVKKAEMMFAVKDSNRVLQEELERLRAQLKRRTRDHEAAVRELEPLRAANKELNLRVDQLGTDRQAAREEAARLRQQYARLVERTACANREERSRIQQERGELCRQLAEETAAQQLLRAQVESLQLEKQDLVHQVQALKQQHAEEIQDLRAKLDVAQQHNDDMLNELDECKKILVENAYMMCDLREKLSAKEALLQDIANKEKQMKEAETERELQQEKEREMSVAVADDAASGSLARQEEATETLDQPRPLGMQEEEAEIVDESAVATEEHTDQYLGIDYRSEGVWHDLFVQCEQLAVQNTSEGELSASTETVSIPCHQSPSQVACTAADTDTHLQLAHTTDATSHTELVPASTTPTQSTVQDMEVEDSAALPHSGEAAVSSQNCEQVESSEVVATSSSPPGVKRLRSMGSNGSGDDVEEEPLQVKRTRTVDSDVEFVCEESLLVEEVKGVEVGLVEEGDSASGSGGEIDESDEPSVDISISAQHPEVTAVEGSGEVMSCEDQSVEPGNGEVGSCVVVEAEQTTSQTAGEHHEQVPEDVNVASDLAPQDVCAYETSPDPGDVESPSCGVSAQQVSPQEGDATLQCMADESDIPDIAVESSEPKKLDVDETENIDGAAGPEEPQAAGAADCGKEEERSAGRLVRGVGLGRRPAARVLKCRGRPVHIVWPRSPAAATGDVAGEGRSVQLASDMSSIPVISVSQSLGEPSGPDVADDTAGGSSDGQDGEDSGSRGPARDTTPVFQYRGKPVRIVWPPGGRHRGRVQLLRQVRVRGAPRPPPQDDKSS